MRVFGFIPIYIIINFIFLNQTAFADATSARSGSPKLFSNGVKFRKLRSFIGVSLEKCEEECNMRTRCRGIVYHKRSTFCVLASKLQTDQGDANGKGTVSIMKSDSAESKTCGSNDCSSRETCEKDENEHACRTLECDELQSMYPDVKGNMLTHKSKVIIDIGGVYKTMVCGEDGLWYTNDSNYDVPTACGDELRETGVYWIPSIVRKVYCDMTSDDGHWIVFQRRQDGTVDFLRNWDSYVTGFGNIGGEFWLGLEPLYHILQAGEYELRVDLESFSGERRYAKYSTFTLAGGNDDYRLGVAGYTGDAGDSLSYHSGMKFSTIDKDNDDNCAQRYEGAWWYKTCHWSNLNGLYLHGGQSTTYANHIQWGSWLGQYQSLKATEMKIRRKWG